ncbi:MAG: T9SS type A sorting domain-containing protein [Cyclobacteriaceae bacterium]|nr:T9SS type A sorting domain-containing protein [Cyclobacteriaceae bacterium]
MRKLLLLFGFLSLMSVSAFAQFSSVTSGNWNDGATWGMTSPGTAGIDYPNAGSSATIIAGTAVTVPTGNFAVGALTINNANSAMLLITGTLEVNGVVNMFPTRGILTVNSGGIIRYRTGSSNATTGGIAGFSIASGGVYEMNYASAGQVPNITFDPGSILRFTGYTSASATTPTFEPGVSLQNVEWNCPNQLNDIYLNTTVNSAMPNIGGYFSVTSTGVLPQYLVMTSGLVGSLNVANDFTISNGAYVVLSDGSGSFDLTVNGNVLISGTGSELDLKQSSGIGSLYPKANLTITSGGIVRTFGAAAGRVIFDGSATHLFSKAGSILGTVDFRVDAPSILDLGTSSLTGTGQFTLNSGATLRVGSLAAAGAIQNSPTSTGNIQVSGARNFNGTCTVEYNGVGAQTMGNGQPTGSGITTIISNPSGVALSASIVFVGNLTLNTGNLIIGPNTLTLNGVFSPGSRFLDVTTSSLISIGGSGNFGTLALTTSQIGYTTPTLNTFTLNRISSGQVTLGTDLSIITGGAFNQTAGDLILNGRTLTISSDFTQGTGTITADAAASLVIDGSGTLPANISIGGLTLNTLSVVRTSPTVAVSPGNLTVSNLNLTDGTLANSGNISMANNGTVTVVSGVMSGNPLGGSSYNVTYSNTGTLSTGAELPAFGTGILNNLMKTGGGTLNLSSAITVNGTMTLSGAFNSGSNAIDLKGNLVVNTNPTFTGSIVTFSGTTSITGSASPTFGAVTITGFVNPSNNYQINGNLINNGTLNNGTLTTTFGGTTLISGSSTNTFYDVTLANGSSLTGPSGNLNVSHTWTNNGGTFNGSAGTVVFTGTNTIAGSSATTFGGINITGTLTAPSAFALGVSGNFANNGVFVHNSGTVTFTGTTFNTVSGSATTFNNINANNPFGTNLSTAVRVNGVLQLLGTTGAFTTNGNLTLSSTSQDNGGSIGRLDDVNKFTGSVTIERYIHSISGGDYRYLSMPITNGNLGLWKSSIGVTGDFADPSTGPNIGNNAAASVYTWNPSTQLYVPVANTGVTLASTSVDSRTGYVAYDFNDGAVTASYSGTIEKGAVPIAISNTNNNFDLIPNPYPSAIDWDLVTKTNVQNAMWLRAGNSIFSSYISGVATQEPFTGWTGEVSTGQSFWVRSNGGGSTFTLNEADKTSASNRFIRTETADNYLRVTLNSSDKQDDMVLRFKDVATDANDSQFDASKKRNGNYVSSLGRFTYMNISSYTTTAADDYSINTIGLVKAGLAKDVKLRVADVVAGSHTLKFTELSTMSLGYTITLIDKYLNKEFEVVDNSTYTFSVNTDAGSYGDSRFVLRINGGAVVTGLEPLSTIGAGAAYPNPVVNKLNIELSAYDDSRLQSIVLIDILGNVLVSSDQRKELLNPGPKVIDMTDYSSGVYILNIKSGNTTKPIRVIRK